VSGVFAAEQLVMQTLTATRALIDEPDVYRDDEKLMGLAVMMRASAAELRACGSEKGLALAVQMEQGADELERLLRDECCGCGHLIEEHEDRDPACPCLRAGCDCETPQL
jgi:hypothetical protein